MKLVAQGAEAKLFEAELEGRKVLVKQRVPKAYRNKQLDDLLRGTRTNVEARMLARARALGIETPRVLKVENAEKEIVMEFVEGKRLKDVLGKKNAGLCKEVGKAIALMHEGNLIHGDLTTSNILVKGGKGLHGKQEHCAAKGSNHSGGQRLCFIDFGLARQSSKAEDKAVDLLVFRKTFEATHVELMPEGWNLILEGYLENKGQKQVLAHMEKVEKRARYH